jgi:hypothetical protein
MYEKVFIVFLWIHFNEFVLTILVASYIAVVGLSPKKQGHGLYSIHNDKFAAMVQYLF